MRKRAPLFFMLKTHTMYSARTFCGALGWLVVAHALYLNPLAPLHEDAATQTCLITQTDACDLACAVRADDGRVYDARALREWLTRCRATNRAACVIEGQLITRVVPVRTRRLLPRKRTFADASTQTEQKEEPPTKRRRRVLIPSARSAFVPYSRQATGLP